MKRTTARLAAAATAIAMLSACGGGGGGEESPKLDDPILLNVAGLWRGATSSNLKVTALTYLDGTGWAVLSDPSTGWITQFATLQGGTSRGAFGGEATTYFLNKEDASVGTPYAGVIVPQTAITLDKLGTGGTFAGEYDKAFEAQPSSTAASGSYTATVNYRTGTVPLIPLFFNLTVASDLTISGGNADCVVSGSMATRAGKRDYTLAMTVADGANPCPITSTSLAGLAFNHQTRQQIVGWLKDSGGIQVAFLASKPVAP